MPKFDVVSREQVIHGMKTAKNPKQQKKIYAELCDCDVSDIDKIMEEDEMKNAWNEKEIARLKEMVGQGIGYAKIGIELVRSYAAVQNKVKELRQKGELPPADPKKTKEPFVSIEPDPMERLAEEMAKCEEWEKKYSVLEEEYQFLLDKYDDLFNNIQSGILIKDADKAEFYRCLGIIEGVSVTLEPCAKAMFREGLSNIEEILEESNGETNDCI